MNVGKSLLYAALLGVFTSFGAALSVFADEFASLQLSGVHIGEIVINGKVIGSSDRHVVRGSGHTITDRRSIADFRHLLVETSADVKWKRGKETALAIIADDNVSPLINTEVKVKTLIISSTGSFSTANSIQIILTSPEIRSVKLFGSGTVNLRSVLADKFDVALLGSGDIYADGSVKDLSVVLSGSGDALFKDLRVDRCEIEIIGSGNAQISVRHSLTANLSGSGDIEYFGSPGKVQTRTDGSGEVYRGN